MPTRVTMSGVVDIFTIRKCDFFSLFFSLVFQQVTKPSAQIGFIRFVLIPLFEALGQLFPVLEVTMISFMLPHLY